MTDVCENCQKLSVQLKQATETITELTRLLEASNSMNKLFGQQNVKLSQKLLEVSGAKQIGKHRA